MGGGEKMEKLIYYEDISIQSYLPHEGAIADRAMEYFDKKMAGQVQIMGVGQKVDMISHSDGSITPLTTVFVRRKV